MLMNDDVSSPSPDIPRRPYVLGAPVLDGFGLGNKEAVMDGARAVYGEKSEVMGDPSDSSPNRLSMDLPHKRAVVDLKKPESPSAVVSLDLMLGDGDESEPLQMPPAPQFAQRPPAARGGWCYCRSGHALTLSKSWTFRINCGTCDACKRSVAKGEDIWVCAPCKWWTCGECKTISAPLLVRSRPLPPPPPRRHCHGSKDEDVTRRD